MTARFANESPVPLYHQIFTLLRQRLVDGTYSALQQLPTEDELASEFGVSRATLRQAVGELVQRGLLVRRQGRGTFVAEGAGIHAGQRFRGSLSDLLDETRRTTVSDIDLKHHAPIPTRVAALLELEEPMATTVRRVRLMAGTVFALTVNYLPNEFGRLLTERELRKSSLMALLQQKGVQLVSGVQWIRSQVAEPLVAESLELDFGDPVLYVERVLYGPSKRPIEVVQSWYRGDAYEYTVALDLSNSHAVNNLA